MEGLLFVLGQGTDIDGFSHTDEYTTFPSTLRATALGARVQPVCTKHSLTNHLVRLEQEREGRGRPSTWAVVRLRTSSNVMGHSAGRSVGLVPLRILSTYI